MTEEDQKETMSINNNDIFNNNNFDIDNIPWIISKYVFENNQEHGYKLHRGDIFKLGKYILRVREIGMEDDKKHYFFENKNTQKYMKNRSISNNNLSQMPLNQQGENYFSALNLNQIINEERKDDGGGENKKESNENIQNNNEEENGSNYNRGNINIIKKESDNSNENENMNNSKNNSNSHSKSNSKSNSHSKSNSNNNSNSHSKSNSKSYSNSNNNSNSKGNNNSIKQNNDNNNFASVIRINPSTNDKREDINQDINNSQRVISIYYSNQSANNNSQSYNYNEIVSYKESNNKENNINNNNDNHYFINIINSSNIDNNNNALDDSKNKINNNSIGFPTFYNNSIFNSSNNNSGKNNSNFNNSSFKNNENENSKMNMNINLNLNNNNNNCQIIKSSFVALKSTASFKKKKLTEIIQKKILKNTGSISEKNNKPICRICLSEEHEENNPLIHPCNCDGTMKYIHLQCLKLLIQSKIKKTETESCKVFTFKTLECEICKMVFPEKISIKGSIFSIIDFEKPDKDYIILDGLIKETPEEKSIFIVHFKNKKEIKIGRATDANIRLSDISVSRAHAIISQYNDSFYLHDTNSKFGTLISAGNRFCILYNKPFSVQKGNILFDFLMKKTFCATLRCYHPSVILYKTYNDYLDETFLYKNQNKDEELLIPEKTKTVSEYSSNIIIKPHRIKVKSSKNIDFFDDSKNNNNELNNNLRKNNESIQSKEDNNKNSSSLSNSNENKSKSSHDNSNSNNNFNESFRVDKDKENKNVGNYQSIGANKTNDISNIFQKNEIIKSNSKNGISLDNNGNENSLLVNNPNNVLNDKS